VRGRKNSARFIDVGLGGLDARVAVQGQVDCGAERDLRGGARHRYRQDGSRDRQLDT
jgi:hypothetical protein